MSKHPEIPRGPYCYSHDGVIDHPVYGRIPKTVPCPHWYVVEASDSGAVTVGGCKLIERTDRDVEGLSLLWDQVKECGINYDEDAEGE